MISINATTRYLRHGISVNDVESYCKYMLVGNSGTTTNFSSTNSGTSPPPSPPPPPPPQPLLQQSSTTPPPPPNTDPPPYSSVVANCWQHKATLQQELPDHYIISLHYSAEGLFAVDDDESRIAWGDEFMLQALASVYHRYLFEMLCFIICRVLMLCVCSFLREVFVALLGDGHMFFLPHSPKVPDPHDLSKKANSSCAIGEVGTPLFLLMRTSGDSNGGDHYEPMVACRQLAVPLQAAREGALEACSTSSVGVPARKVLAVLGEV